MPQEVTASCICGAVRISCGTPLGPGSYCHCHDCRKSTGSAFSVAVPFDADDFRVLSGEVGTFKKTADSGAELTRHFCPSCGSPLFGTSPRHPDRVFVKAGVLDQQSLVQPSHQSWCQSKVGWSMIDPELPSYPRSKS